MTPRIRKPSKAALQTMEYQERAKEFSASESEEEGMDSSSSVDTTQFKHGEESEDEVRALADERIKNSQSRSHSDAENKFQHNVVNPESILVDKIIDTVATERVGSSPSREKEFVINGASSLESGLPRSTMAKRKVELLTDKHREEKSTPWKLVTVKEESGMDGYDPTPTTPSKSSKKRPHSTLNPSLFSEEDNDTTKAPKKRRFPISPRKAGVWTAQETNIIMTNMYDKTIHHDAVRSALRKYWQELEDKGKCVTRKDSKSISNKVGRLHNSFHKMSESFVTKGKGSR